MTPDKNSITHPVSTKQNRISWTRLDKPGSAPGSVRGQGPERVDSHSERMIGKQTLGQYPIEFTLPRSGSIDSVSLNFNFP